MPRRTPRNARWVRGRPLTITSAVAARGIARTPGTIAASVVSATSREAIPLSTKNARGHTVGTSNSSASTIRPIAQR